MRCIDCEYELRNLMPFGGEHRCPECGRGFDPDDPATVAPIQVEMNPAQRWFMAVWLMSALAAGMAAEGVRFLWFR
jgi:hypothetical protein